MTTACSQLCRRGDAGDLGPNVAMLSEQGLTSVLIHMLQITGSASGLTTHVPCAMRAWVVTKFVLDAPSPAHIHHRPAADPARYDVVCQVRQIL